MSQQKSFKTSNLNSVIWSYREGRAIEIVGTQKDTLSIENGIMGITELYPLSS